MNAVDKPIRSIYRLLFEKLLSMSTMLERVCIHEFKNHEEYAVTTRKSKNFDLFTRENRNEKRRNPVVLTFENSDDYAFNLLDN